MPFTLSHPAIILPFARIRHHYICISCLVAGSMAPDFEYFIKMKLSGRYSHTVAGAFLFDVPVAIAMLLIFHLVIKRPLINSLPPYFNNRLVTLREFDFLPYSRRYFIPCLICILIGVFSHIIWDSFTHANGYFVKRISFLSAPAGIQGMFVYPLFRYLQHVSTGLGALYIIATFHNQKKTALKSKIDYGYWLTVAGIGLTVYWIRASFGFEYFGDLVATALSSFFIGLTLVSLTRILTAKHEQHP